MPKQVINPTDPYRTLAFVPMNTTSQTYPSSNEKCNNLILDLLLIDQSDVVSSAVRSELYTLFVRQFARSESVNCQLPLLEVVFSD